MELLSYIFFFVQFFLAIFLAFFVPGRVLIGKYQKISPFIVIVLSIIFGMVLWGWQAYIFGYLHIRWMSYIFILLFLLLFIWKKYSLIPEFEVKSLWRRIDKLGLTLIIIGVLGSTFFYFSNGTYTKEGMYFSAMNSHDHIWHVALIDEISHHFPPLEPSISNVPLRNYHYWFHLVTGDLIRVFYLPLFSTVFLGMYPLIALFLGVMAYIFSTIIYDNRAFRRFLLFFLYFSGDAATWVILLLRGKFTFQAESLIDDSLKLIDNPGRVVGLIIALAAFYLFYSYRNKLSLSHSILIALSLGSLVGYKVYVAIPFLAGLGIIVFLDLLKKRYQTLFLFLITLILSGVVFLPSNSSSGGLLFLPFEIPRDFLTQKAFGLSYVDLRLNIYHDHNNYLRLLEYGILMSIFYFIVQWGTRLIGLVPLKKSLKLLSAEKTLFFAAIFLSGFILGLFFFQKVGGSNIWEFFLTSSFILSFLAALNASVLVEKLKRPVSLLLIAVIVILTIPRFIGTLSERYHFNYELGFYGYTYDELNSYAFLHNSTPEGSVILFYPTNMNLGNASLASVFIQRPLYLSGYGTEPNDSPYIKDRISLVKYLTTAYVPKEIYATLRNASIDYLYLPKGDQNIHYYLTYKIQPVFKNKVATIYEIMKE